MTLRSFSDADATPDKVVLYAQKGWGKTTLGAQTPNPIILMSRGETGYLTLRRNNLVPDAPFAIIDTWEQLESQLRELIVKGVGDRQTLVLDALGGFERLCHEFICQQKFNGDWGERGFTGFMRGYTMSVPEITKLLDLLDEVNRKLKLRVVVLAHARVKVFNNPMGAAFDRYIVDCHEKTWEPLNGWADAVLFGKTVTKIAVVDGDKKGVGGDERVVFTQFCDAFEAKNRHGLPKEIKMPSKVEGMWAAVGEKLAAAVKGVGGAGPTSAPSAAAATASTPAPSSEQPKEDGAKWDATMMELTMLIKQYNLQDKVEGVCKSMKVKTLDELTIPQLEQVINKIKSKYQAKQAA